MSKCSQVISLSSDEEEKKDDQPPRKRIKPLLLETQAVIISSDEESGNAQGGNDLDQVGSSDTKNSENHRAQEVESSSQKISSKECDSPSTCDTKEILEHSAIDHLETYFTTCSRSIENSKYESLKEKFSLLKKQYERYICDRGYDEDIKKLIEDHIVKASQSSADAVLSFDEVLTYVSTVPADEHIEIPPEHAKKVKLLLKTCLKLIHKIRKLECTEVDWDDENDSVYIQEDRYKQRLMKVFSQYCKYVNMNPYTGRLTYKKFEFATSRYSEINEAITKKYKSCRTFPTYVNIEKIIRDCIENHGLALSENSIKKESEVCFKALGEFFQKRRKQELYESHYHFIKDSNDPAALDNNLEKCLKENFSEGMKKIEALYEEFVEKQMQDPELELSEDSDDSNYVDSDDS